MYVGEVPAPFCSDARHDEQVLGDLVADEPTPQRDLLSPARARAAGVVVVACGRRESACREAQALVIDRDRDSHELRVCAERAGARREGLRAAALHVARKRGTAAFEEEG